MILTLLKLRKKNQHSRTNIKIKKNITKFPEVVFNTLVYYKSCFRSREIVNNQRYLPCT